MKAVLQRVSSASVIVGGTMVASIGAGFVALVGVERDDTPADAATIADKVAHLRVFADDAGKMNLALGDVGGSALVVSQFTLLGDARKGRRPSFAGAAPPDLAEPLYEMVCSGIAAAGVPVQRGVFGALMYVALVNDGPVTILLDSRR